MDSATIRKTFIDFFAEREHKIVPSSSLVPDDPTLLLTNAGMVQFKPYFLGEKSLAYPRAASVQKCFREIDLEEVGRTARHLTFFEMLGNFAFGDYFKKEACTWAWELLTVRFNLPIKKLWITVYEADDESAKIWEDEVGVAPDRVLRRTRAEGNFWDMGVAGPCGPCSELLYDRGDEFGQPYSGGDLDEERYLEVWNLVFMQHMQNKEGEIVGDLPSLNVDTGMGLERLASILQDVPSAFEIDTMTPILRAAEQATGQSYGRSSRADVGLRVLAEHSRSMAFLIADGVFPSNTGRGYVLRRLIRRALRHARLLQVSEPLLPELALLAVDVYADAYPEVARNRDLIARLVGKEEERFELIHEQGLGFLEDEIERVRQAGANQLSGEVVFKLHDTYGFPLDLTTDIAKDENLSIDMQSFDREMAGQKKKAREARKGAKDDTKSASLEALLARSGPSEFLGYEKLELDTAVVGLLQGLEPVEALTQGAEGRVVLASTPFYAEGGGQVGDRGTIRMSSGTFQVENTRKGIPGIIVHEGKVSAGEIKAGDDAFAGVDSSHREGVVRSHTATHILHWALRDVLGEHAKQQGSLVEPGRLHFDFSHFEGISAELLAEIEQELNRRVLWDDSVRTFETTFDYATSIGAMALFGEKYGDNVRVVEVGEYSKELCGGTHVVRTGQIGVIKLLKEGSVGAGVRRIEALTGSAGLDYLNDQASRLERTAEMLKTDPAHVVDKLEKMIETIKELEAALSEQHHKEQRAEIARLVAADDVRAIGPGRLLVKVLEEGADLRKMATGLRQAIGTGIVVVGAGDGSKGSVAVAVSKDLVERGVAAPGIIQSIKGMLGGGGGGKPDLAVAGGPNHTALSDAVNAAGREAAGILETIDK